jgi:hypothetical protein
MPVSGLRQALMTRWCSMMLLEKGIPKVGVTFYMNERILTRKHYQRFQIELAL